MSKKNLFVARRNHEGDKSYKTGDFREASITQVKHLLGKTLRAASEQEAELFSKGATSINSAPGAGGSGAKELKLTDIKGLGKATAVKLTEAGVDTVETLAELSVERGEELEAELGVKVVSLSEAAQELLADDD